MRGGIARLASQSTARYATLSRAHLRLLRSQPRPPQHTVRFPFRLGIISGMAGVAFGMSATIGSVPTLNNWDAGTYAQLAGVLGGGGALGYAIAQRVDPTSLPQTVAAFHSLVGLAAVFTAVGDYMEHAVRHPDPNRRHAPHPRACTRDRDWRGHGDGIDDRVRQVEREPRFVTAVARYA